MLSGDNRRPNRAWQRPLILFAVVAHGVGLSAGCSPTHSAKRTLFRDLTQFPATTDAKLSCRLYGQWARQEWSEWVNSEAGITEVPTSAFERGFLDGFVDTVYAGGSGEPPMVPPKRFWRVMFRNEMGDHEISEWSRGFRVGSTIALDRGYRDRALVPTTRMLEQQIPGAFLLDENGTTPTLIEEGYPQHLPDLKPPMRSSTNFQTISTSPADPLSVPSALPPIDSQMQLPPLVEP